MSATFRLFGMISEIGKLATVGQAGTQVIDFKVATAESWKDSVRTTVHPVRCYGKTTALLSDGGFTEGDRVMIVGKVASKPSSKGDRIFVDLVATWIERVVDPSAEEDKF